MFATQREPLLRAEVETPIPAPLFTMFPMGTTRAPGRRYARDVVEAARRVEQALGWAR